MSLYKNLQESHMQLPWKALAIIFKDLPAIPKKGVLHESGRCVNVGHFPLLNTTIEFFGPYLKKSFFNLFGPDEDLQKIVQETNK